MDKEYTVIIRKTNLSYIAICLELNISSTGDTIEEVEHNLKNAMDIYLEDLSENPKTIVEPISIKDFTEFLKDTESEDEQQKYNMKFFKTFEINNLPVYA